MTSSNPSLGLLSYKYSVVKCPCFCLKIHIQSQLINKSARIYIWDPSNLSNVLRDQGKSRQLCFSFCFTAHWLLKPIAVVSRGWKWKKCIKWLININLLLSGFLVAFCHRLDQGMFYTRTNELLPLKSNVIVRHQEKWALYGTCRETGCCYCC